MNGILFYIILHITSVYPGFTNACIYLHYVRMKKKEVTCIKHVSVIVIKVIITINVINSTKNVIKTVNVITLNRKCNYQP